MDTNPAAVHMILGVIQTSRGDKAKAYGHHERASKLAPGDTLCVRNWASSCVRFNDFERAIEKYREAEALAPTDIHIKLNFLNTYSLAGKYIEGNKLLDEYRQKGFVAQMKKQTDTTVIDQLQKMASMMGSFNLKDEDMVLLKGIVHKTTGISADEKIEAWSDDETLYFLVRIDAEVDEVVAMNEKLIDELVDADDEVTSRFSRVSLSLCPEE